MKQFSLDEYLKNPNRSIVTRDGKNARIICTDKDNSKYSIVALIQEDWGEVVHCYTPDGMFVESTRKSTEDLFFVPEKKEGWIHLCKSDNKYPYVRSSVFETKEEAEKYRRANDDSIATIKIEWEE